MRYVPSIHDPDVNLSAGAPWRQFLAMVCGLFAAILLLYLASGFVVGWAAQLISVEQEQALWRGTDAMAGETPVPTMPEPGLRAATRWAQALLDRIPYDARGEAAGYELRVIVEPDIQPNAFALAGGTVVVTTGLLAFAHSENEVLAVLGHEIGHFAGRDHLEDTGRMLVATALSMALLGQDSGMTEWLSEGITLIDRRYSRQQELDADLFGLAAVVAVYGHAGGAADMDERLMLYLEEPRGYEAMMSTHPASRDRIELIRDAIAESGFEERAVIPLPRWLQRDVARFH